MKGLPIGEQSFANLRESNGIYVDKTTYIYNLLHGSSRYYFLSRPRRFGKSLLLSKLEHIFKGDKHLFEGTWIHDKIDFTPHPVLLFDMSALDYKEQSLREALVWDLELKAERFGIVLKGKIPKTMFQELLETLSAQKQVVVLIDEYDKPIHDYLDNLKQAEANRKTLANFYGVIKSSAKYLRFCMLTGVSRFSKISVFSELNHLVDITLDEAYAGMLGYTQEETAHYFKHYLEEIAPRYKMTLEELMMVVKEWYNGYTWDSKTFVYNPFSFMNFCREKNFYNYWFDTGTPTFLTKLLHKNLEYDFDNVEVEQFGLSSTSITDLDWRSLLFQTGYITIKEIAYTTNKISYTLAYPNKEVRDALLQYLLMEYTRNFQLSNVMPRTGKLRQALREDDMEEFISIFNSVFATIPYQIFIEHLEAYYHAVVFLTLQLVGIDVKAEVSQAKGRADAIIFFEHTIYILEFKLDETAERALQQIKDKEYAKPYLHEGKEIHLLGLNMTSKDKKITSFAKERL